VIALARIVLRLLADLAGLVVRVGSVLGGLHHEYLLVPALA
jgi:hypothetical protein